MSWASFLLDAGGLAVAGAIAVLTLRSMGRLVDRLLQQIADHHAEAMASGRHVAEAVERYAAATSSRGSKVDQALAVLLDRVGHRMPTSDRPKWPGTDPGANPSP